MRFVKLINKDKQRHWIPMALLVFVWAVREYNRTPYSYFEIF